MHQIIRKWIVDVMKAHAPVLAVAMRQRAKFEGWLKFELAAHAAAKGARDIAVEAGYNDGTGRADLTFVLNDRRCFLELKTPNASYRMPGVQNKTRPITNNVASIIADAKKLQGCGEYGLVAFVLFPVPVGNNQWAAYLDRIAKEVGVPLLEGHHWCRVTLSLDAKQYCEAVVCCLPVGTKHSAGCGANS